jgi:hypothetical protein
MEGHRDWPALWRCLQHNRSVTEDEQNNEMSNNIQDNQREAVRLIYTVCDSDYVHYRASVKPGLQKDRKFVQHTEINYSKFTVISSYHNRVLCYWRTELMGNEKCACAYHYTVTALLKLLVSKHCSKSYGCHLTANCTTYELFRVSPYVKLLQTDRHKNGGSDIWGGTTFIIIIFIIIIIILYLLSQAYSSW